MKPREVGDSSTSGSRKIENEYGPDELILLLVYLYSLANEAKPADQETEEEELEKLERELIGALTLIITQERELGPLLQKLTGERKLTQSQLCDYFQEHAQFARFSRLKGKNQSKKIGTDGIYFLLSAFGAVNGGDFLSNSQHPILLLDSLYHTFFYRQNTFCGWFGKQQHKKSQVWECLYLCKCERKIAWEENDPSL